MPIPVLTTKLHPPSGRPDILPRPRLTGHLDEGRRRPLTLVSAPAGYGKSTLISHWLYSRDEPYSWLSLDDTDNDLRVFTSYIVAAIRAALPQACPQTLAMLEGSAQLPVTALGTCLTNELDALDTPLNLALDDYHCIVQPAVHELLSFLLQHPPRPLHLVILTRRDPPLPLSSLFAQGLGTEVRLKDLEFSVSETKNLIAQSAGIAVSDRAVANVHHQLEGWIAGLHLVLVNLRYQEDPADFLSKLSGGTARVQAYLLGEVFARQSPAVQNWLKMTSILNRFCAPLCEALCLPNQQEDTPELNGDSFISALVANNLFCIPLDDHGQWYRYHHLFQQLLTERLRRDCDVREISASHSRACDWFESQGLIEEAIRRALLAEDDTRAAELVEAYRDDESTADRWYVVERWLAMLPDEIKRDRPRLLLTEAWIANCRFQLARVPQLIGQVEEHLCGQTAEPTLLGELAFYKGALEYWEGQAESSRQSLEQAVSQLSDRQPYFESEAHLMLGLARCMAGQEELAVRALEDLIDRGDSPGGQVLSRRIAGLVFVHLLCGNLPRAQVAAERLQLVARQSGIRNTEAWSSYLLGYAHLHASELATAARHFAFAVEQRHVLEPRAAVDAVAGLALTQHLLRLEDQAAVTADLLQEFAQALDDRHYASVARSCRARLSLLRGELTSALQWARSTSESPVPSQLFMWLEAPTITQARVLIAAGAEQDLRKGTELLQAIRSQSEACRFVCQTIEVAVLQSLALEKQGRAEEALAVLKEAVALAEPGGWVRPFVELGQPLADLLRGLLKQGVAVDYARQILAAFRDHRPQPAQGAAPKHGLSPSSSREPLIEPLTNREEEVLELLGQRLSDKEIAERLYLSPATVNTHLKHIYEKLQVGNRRKAVARAGELGILPSG